MQFTAQKRKYDSSFRFILHQNVHFANHKMWLHLLYEPLILQFFVKLIWQILLALMKEVKSHPIIYTTEYTPNNIAVTHDQKNTSCKSIQNISFFMEKKNSNQVKI